MNSVSGRAILAYCLYQWANRFCAIFADNFCLCYSLRFFQLCLKSSVFTLLRCVYLKTLRHRDILTHLDIFVLLTQSQWPRPFVKHGVSPARSSPTYPNFKTELVYASSSSEAEQRIPKAFLLSFFTFPSWLGALHEQWQNMKFHWWLPKTSLESFPRAYNFIGMLYLSNRGK